MDETSYQSWKRQWVVDALARHGFEEHLVEALIRCPTPSRRRATFSVKKRNGDVSFGFRGHRSHQIEDVFSCSILTPFLNDSLGEVRELAATIPCTLFSLSITECLDGVDVNIEADDLDDIDLLSIDRLAERLESASVIRLSLNGMSVLTLRPPKIEFGDISVALPPGAFLQASIEGEAILIDCVSRIAAQSRKVADLFCGSGTFAGALSRNRFVAAFDVDRASVDALDLAAKAANRADKLVARPRNLFENPVRPDELNAFDFVVLDPPRAGGLAQSKALAASTISTLAYVSCNPATFVRDAAILRDGGFDLERVTPVDQFVYSPHIELVAAFRKA